MTHVAMSEPMLARVAEQFKALGEPSRLRLMNLLFDGEASVGELAQRSGMTLANVSKQLGLLHRVGWVARRKDGLNVLYSLADARVGQLCQLMCRRVQDLTAAEYRSVGAVARRRR